MDESAKFRQLLLFTATAAGVLLLAINLAGIFLFSLRAPEIDGYTDFAGDQTLPYKESERELRAAPPYIGSTDTKAFFTRTTRLFNRAIAHIDPADVAKNGFVHYNMTVPIWENYVLYALSFLKPDTYRDYEFCSVDKILQRGTGRCGQQSLAMVGYLSKLGYETGFVYLTGHTLVTARAPDSGWFLLDPDFGGVMPFDLKQAEEDPAKILDYYWSPAARDRHLDRLFANGSAYTKYGGQSVRWGRACTIEQVAYILKWLIPLLCLLPAGWMMWRRVRQKGG